MKLLVAQASPPARSCPSPATVDAGGTPALQKYLLDPAAYPHPAPAPRLIETHISWVFLAGDYAYKLKKPVNLGFLDFSTLEKREHCCREEVRLNSRLAPDIYLGVVPVAGTPPQVEGEGPVLEWAVKMRAFPADATLDREAEITPEQIDAIADRVARFHSEITAAPAESGFGLPDAVRAPVAENFRQLRALLPSPSGGGAGGEGTRIGDLDARALTPGPSPEGRGETIARLDALEAWSEAEGRRLADHFTARRAEGYIRECHGDLHLGNIAWLAGELPPLSKALSAAAGDMSEGTGESGFPLLKRGIEGDLAAFACAAVSNPPPSPPLIKGGTSENPPQPPFEKGGSPLIFDGIEFNPGLRMIDVISEIAFLCMDLMHRGKAALAWRFLNRYLEHSGDTAGLAALPYYLVYRAMVRAKVSAIKASQSDGDFAETLSYLELAQRITQRPAAALLLMHGVSGCGKTWVSQSLLEDLGAICLRSDVERKRLFGLTALADSRAAGEDIYSREAGARTLARLLELTKTLLSAGFRVIVDATFIKRDWREPFQKLAEERGIPWWIAALEAPSEVLRQRVAARQASGHDASEAGPEVLAAQLAAVEPFNEAELPHVVPLSGTPLQTVSQIQVLLP
ncbi:MAG: AAA family ATPase [Gammaproteobacteria bacterium]|nr:AAA family ATPase [Gammaproteobacteria bacterium]